MKRKQDSRDEIKTRDYKEYKQRCGGQARNSQNNNY